MQHATQHLFDNVLHRVRCATSDDTSEQQMLDETVREVARALGVPISKVLELEEGGEWFLVRAGVGLASTEIGNDRVTTATTSHAGLALHVGAPVICMDLGRIRHLCDAALLRRHGAVSGVAVPIGHTDKPFGVLSAHATVRREFTAQEIGLLSRVASLVAHGLRRRRARVPS